MASKTTEEQLREKFPDLEYTKIPHPSEHPHCRYYGFEPGNTTVLSKGHVRFPGKKAFPVDVVFDRDQAVSMRDGVKIYADIFRPLKPENAKVPVLISWSPYGISGAGVQQYETMGPFNCGVDLEKLSGYEKFEGADPAEWCQRGYAIANVDARGAGNSEGNVYLWGIQEAEDIYDTIEWIVKLWEDIPIKLV